MGKRVTIAAAWIFFLSWQKGLAFQQPDPQDSVILESKTVMPGVGTTASPAAYVRVFITNKDTLIGYEISIMERSLSGGAYMTLSYPRTFAGVVRPLTNTFLFYRDIQAWRFNSSSPDTLVIFGISDPLNDADWEPPNFSRKPLLDIKFDSVWNAGGMIEFDSALIVEPDSEVTRIHWTHFVATGIRSTGVNYAKGIVTVKSHGIFCPPDTTVGNDAGRCDAAVNYTVTAEPPGSTILCAPMPGSTFPRGTTQVTCIATDTAGNADTCSFTVTVLDEEAPVLTCPRDTAAQALPSQCRAEVNYPPPVASDNCPGVVAVVCSPPSGSSFPVGQSMVTCAATDSAGNADSCFFTVTVREFPAVPPTVQCPADTVAASDSGLCSRVVEFAATAADNCPGASVDCSPPSGSVFSVGTASVLCIATDASGNRDSCRFNVTVTASVAKGDMNNDGEFRPSDVVLLLNCVFQSTGSCEHCYADVNCDGQLSPADVVIELNGVFLAEPIGC